MKQVENPKYHLGIPGKVSFPSKIICLLLLQKKKLDPQPGTSSYIIYPSWGVTCWMIMRWAVMSGPQCPYVTY